MMSTRQLLRSNLFLFLFFSVNIGFAQDSINAKSDTLQLYASLKTALDKSYHTTQPNGSFYFKFDCLYSTSPNEFLDYHLYDWQHNSLVDTLLPIKHGMNWYRLDLLNIGQENQYYILEVRDKHKQLSILRLKYMMPTPLKIVLSQPSPCFGQDINLEARLTGGQTPYHVDWYVAVGDTLSNQSWEEVNKSEDTKYKELDYIIPSVSFNAYFIKAKVKDSNGTIREKSVEINALNCPELFSEDRSKKSKNPPNRMRVIFSIRNIILSGKINNSGNN
jgi:hypothetical protein